MLSEFEEIRTGYYPETLGAVETINPEDTISSISRHYPDTNHILVFCEYGNGARVCGADSKRKLPVK